MFSSLVHGTAASPWSQARQTAVHHNNGYQQQQLPLSIPSEALVGQVNNWDEYDQNYVWLLQGSPRCISWLVEYSSL